MNNEQIKETSPAEPQNLSDVDEAADSILARWTDDTKNPSGTETEATETETNEIKDQDQDNEEEKPNEENLEETNEDPSTDEETDSEDIDEDEDTDSDDTTTELSDETEIDVIVDGEAQKVSIKNLKRLHGQEASLTRKSQEVARQRKEADDAISKSTTVMDAMIKKAEERYKPYKEVDMLLASKTMSDTDFAQLRKEAQAAHDDLNFLTKEADGLYKDLQEQQKVALQNAAKECVQVLQDNIPDWSNSLYNDIRSYAVRQGFAEQEVNNYVDPKVIQILNKARLYDEGKKVASIKKANPTSKRVLKSKKAPPTAQNQKNVKVAEARKRMRTSTDLDDVAEALMSRWET
jgi:hypothetical protein